MSPLSRRVLPAALLALAASTHPAFAQVPQDYSTNIVAPFYTNVANFDTTTTTSSPTFTRPAITLGTVTSAPLNPSHIGTAVGYATASFTPGDSNQYRVTTTIDNGYAVTSGSSNLVQLLDQGTFDPTDKTFANSVLAYNPAGSTGSYMTDLTGGQAYTFVNGGRYNSNLTGAQLSLGTVTTKIDEYSQGSLTAIPQASTLAPNTVSQTLSIYGGGAISSFNSFDITGLSQIYLGGLTATLTHDGVSVNLFNQIGADPSNYNQGSSANFDGENYYFTDSGADLAAAAAAQEPPAGSLADPGSVAGGAANPYKSLDSLSAFNGMSVNGDWTLSLTDSDQGNDGTFTGFSFNATTPVPEASSVVSLSLLLALGLGAVVVARRRMSANSSN